MAAFPIRGENSSLPKPPTWQTPGTLPAQEEEKPLPYLPALFAVNNDLDLYIDVLSNQYAKEAYSLVCAAAVRGDNIALDEFPTMESFAQLLEAADTFIALDSRNGRMMALLIFGPSTYSRSSDPVYADGYIVLDDSLQKLDIYRQLLQISLQFVKDLEYEGCLVNTFTSHTNSILALRAEGFVVVGCIPMSGYVHGQGWTESMMLFKDLEHVTLKVIPMKSAGTTRIQPVLKLASPTKPKSSMSALTSGSMVTKFTPMKQGNANLNNSIPQKLVSRLSYFPLTYKVSGKDVCLDYVKDSECQELFDLYKLSAQKGQGYGEDEFTNLDAFKSNFVLNGHAIIGRDPLTGKILLSFSITPSPYCRSSNPLVADGYILVDPGFRGKGVGLQTTRLMLRIIKDIGYVGAVSDTFITNIPMYKLMIAVGFNPVAYLPKCAFVKDKGWTDAVILYKGLTDNLSVLPKL